MPDFETIKLRAPYWADLPDRNGIRSRTWIVDEFDVVVAHARDTVKVATIEGRARGRTWSCDFLHLEDRLFRPHYGEEVGYPFRERDIRKLPLGICLSPDRAYYEHERLPFLASPFLPCVYGSESRETRKARQCAPEAREETARMVAALGSSLRLIDGKLFQETRSPAWHVHPDELHVRAILPDYHRLAGFLIDPRHGDAKLRQSSTGEGTDKIEVYEPALLPDTVEVDAIGAFCLLLREDLNDADGARMDSGFREQASALLRDAEAVVVERAPLGSWYADLGRLAEWDDPDGPGTAPEAVPAFHAAAFVQHLAEFPPPDRSVGDDIDAGGLSL